VASWTLLPACAEEERVEVAEVVPVDLIEGFSTASVGPDVVELDLGTPASRRNLGHGWARDGQAPDRDFVWGLGASSQVRVELGQPGHVALTIDARPYGGAGLDGQTVTLVANNQEFGTVALDDGWGRYRVVAPRGVFVDGENNLELRYGWSAVPSEHSESDDQRALAVAFDRLLFDPDATAAGLPDDRPRSATVDFGAPTSHDQLVSGWGGREQGPSGDSYSWATGRRAEVSLELGRPVASVLSMRVRPFSWPDAPEQRMEVSVNGTPTMTQALAEGWQDISAELPASMFQVGSNTVTMSFSHAHSPADLGLGADSRKLAVAFDWLTVTPQLVPSVHEDHRLHLPLGIRTAYPLSLPSSSVLQVEMADQDATLVVELTDMRSGRRQVWSLQESGELPLSGADDPTRLTRLSFIARRGTGARSLVLDRVSVYTNGDEAPSLIGLRPRSQAAADGLPGSP
jgi:hypothetical protein